MLLHMHHITHTFGNKHILDDISLVVNSGDRIGIVGANGAGKSTLLAIAASRLACDSGHMVYAPAVEVGYMSQTPEHAPTDTIAGVLTRARQRIAMLEEQMHALAAHMSGAVHAEQVAMIAAYGEKEARFEQAGGYNLEHKISLVLDGLRLTYLPHNRPMDTLSGGEKTRIALAALLLQAPDVLLLDEPTNHLDAPTAAWLEDFLLQQPGAVLVVSHDRHFLDRVVTRIAELDEHTHHLTCYGGDYTAYTLQKQRMRQAWEEAYARQQKEIADLQRKIKTTPQRIATHRNIRDNDKLLYNFKGERLQQTITREIRAAEQRLQRIQDNPILPPPKPLHFNAHLNVACPLQANDTIIQATHICKAFGTQPPVLHNISLAIKATDRILLVGANGVGKTTLLCILASNLAPDSGTVSWSPNANIGFLPQEDSVPPDNRTVLQSYREGQIGYEDDIQAALLAYGLFVPDDIHRPVRTLSVGQRRKLHLARLLAMRPNVLLLDEPTNQFSLDVVEQLEHALDAFPGAIVAVSHDRRFMQHFRGTYWQLQDGYLKT